MILSCVQSGTIGSKLPRTLLPISQDSVDLRNDQK